MAVTKLDPNGLYGFPITDLGSATAEDMQGGITLPVLVQLSDGTYTYKVVPAKTYIDLVKQIANAGVGTIKESLNSAVKKSEDQTSLCKTATDNANSKIADLNDAAQKASQLETKVTSMEGRVADVGTVIDNADKATTNANAAATAANTAKDDADKAAAAANTAASSANTAKTNADKATAAANKAASDANNAAGAANTAKANADKATTAANSAADKANDTASHPGYVDADGYYCKYNADTKAYEKTTVNLKGPQGNKGDKGDPLTYESLTDAQKDEMASRVSIGTISDAEIAAIIDA
ncbi:MAG: hypothetical protein LKE41_00975 [Prevotella sp.]|jgi:chemotaxis protein histidine kinase CheA|nr:hypothetical protein [Prevotella sp.]